jgi:hypothetical protein
MDNELLKNMINNIMSGNNTDAVDNFNSVISAKVSDAIETKKQEIAATLGEKDEDTE